MKAWAFATSIATTTDGHLKAVTDRPIILVAACALVDADGRVLIAQRPQGKSMAGLWEFPGGKVEASETPEETVIRELEEELGIVTQTDCLAPLTFASHAYDDFHLLMPLYICRRYQGVPQPKEGAGAQMGTAAGDARLSDAAGGRTADPLPDRSDLKSVVWSGPRAC